MASVVENVRHSAVQEPRSQTDVAVKSLVEDGVQVEALLRLRLVARKAGG